MIQAIVFDCFGVLYTEAKDVYASHFPQFADEFRNLGSASDRGFIERHEYLESMSKLTGDDPAKIDKLLTAAHTANQPLIEYMRRELKPHYKIGLLSNIGQDWMQNFFDEHALHDLFDAVVLSSSEGYAKPEPEIYRVMLERLGVPAENAVMIDDREVNCHGAEAVGMKSLQYNTYEKMLSELTKILNGA